MENLFDKEKFAQKIKEIRLSKGLTQEKVSEMIDVDPSHYSNIETSKTTPSMPTLVKLVNALNISYDELFECAHLEDEEIIDEMIKTIYDRFSLQKKRRLYKILRAIEEDL